jgi:hypothetical protein
MARSLTLRTHVSAAAVDGRTRDHFEATPPAYDRAALTSDMARAGGESAA